MYIRTNQTVKRHVQNMYLRTKSDTNKQYVQHMYIRTKSDSKHDMYITCT